MTPKEYYYNHFRKHFTEFVKGSNAHQHDDGTYISGQELWKEELLSFIPKEEKNLFLYSLACTVLIDQVMYTHFKSDYHTFQSMTLYPKFEYGITGVNINPWWLANQSKTSTGFSDFVNFFIADLKVFFLENKFAEANWEAVKLAMLNDPDVSSVTYGIYGKIFAEELKK